MTEEKLHQLVTFKIGQEEFGLPVLNVNEIIFCSALQPVSSSLPSMIGLIQLRGTVLRVIDFRLLLEKEARVPSKKNRIIIITHQNETIGLLVDEVTQVMPMTNMDIDSSFHGYNTYVNGLCKNNERIVFMIDLLALFSKIEGEKHVN